MGNGKLHYQSVISHQQISLWKRDFPTLGQFLKTAIGANTFCIILKGHIAEIDRTEMDRIDRAGRKTKRYAFRRFGCSNQGVPS